MQKDRYLDITYPYSTCYPKMLAVYLYTHYLKPESTLLDIGCGQGEYLESFLSLKIDAYGVDKRTVDTKIQLNKKIYQCNLENSSLLFTDNSIDTVFSKSAIEHIWNTENFLTEAYRVLKPNGNIIIMTPDWSSIYKDFYLDYTHIKPFTEKGLRDALKIFGFKEVQVSKFYQLPLIWKYPYLKYSCKLISALIPDCFKYKDKEQTINRNWVRFSKEPLLLGIGVK